MRRLIEVGSGSCSTNKVSHNYKSNIHLNTRMCKSIT